MCVKLTPGPETEAAIWNSAIVHFIIYTCTLPTSFLRSLMTNEFTVHQVTRGNILHSTDEGKTAKAMSYMAMFMKLSQRCDPWFLFPSKGLGFFLGPCFTQNPASSFSVMLTDTREPKTWHPGRLNKSTAFQLVSLSLSLGGSRLRPVSGNTTFFPLDGNWPTFLLAL